MAKVLELAGNSKKTRIIPRHNLLAARNDKELHKNCLMMISKRNALGGWCSGAQALLEIERGNVLVDGHPVTENHKIPHSSELLCNGVDIPPPSLEQKMWDFNKPKNTVSDLNYKRESTDQFSIPDVIDTFVQRQED